jgi:hypothetical protein
LFEFGALFWRQVKGYLFAHIHSVPDTRHHT